MDIVTGGKLGSDKGFYYQPTVVAGALQDDEIVRREVFGPVVSVTRFNDDTDVIGWANDSGLRPGLLRLDQGCVQGHEGIRQAAIWLHLGEHAFHADQEMPHGGVKQVRLWQGHVDVCARGLHRRPPCDDCSLNENVIHWGSRTEDVRSPFVLIKERWMPDLAETMRVFEPYPGLFAFYDGRIAASGCIRRKKHWLDGRRYSLGIAAYALVRRRRRHRL